MFIRCSLYVWTHVLIFFKNLQKNETKQTKTKQKTKMESAFPFRLTSEMSHVRKQFLNA